MKKFYLIKELLKIFKPYIDLVTQVGRIFVIWGTFFTMFPTGVRMLILFIKNNFL